MEIIGTVGRSKKNPILLAAFEEEETGCLRYYAMIPLLGKSTETFSMLWQRAKKKLTRKKA